MDQRLRSVCDLFVGDLREGSGLHEYDGLIQDLSPGGVRAGLARLGGPPLDDPHDEAHLQAFEDNARLAFGELEVHRSNPSTHLPNFDLSCYDREYAPASDRAAAKRAHLAQWPDAVDMTIESLDAVPAPVAAALLGAFTGLVSAVNPADPRASAALAAHARLMSHLQDAAEHGSPDASLGARGLASLMGSFEATTVDIGRLAEIADSERDRLTAMLREACARIDRDATLEQAVAAIVADHPDADGVLAEAQAQVDEVLAFTREHDLVPYTDGECIVAPAPESRRWAMAMMAWAAPGETDAPSFYWVTPPDPNWSAHDIEDWLQIFSRATLPAITLHEVSPGHFAHGRALRRAATPVRRILMSPAFVEGWAHYTEELSLDLGFRAGDPRFAAGVAIEGLVRVTRLAAAIGVHTGAMTVDDAARRFESDAFLVGAGRTIRSQPRDVRPDVRPLHLGEARHPRNTGEGTAGLGRRLLTQPIPQGDARPRCATTGFARDGGRARLAAHAGSSRSTSSHCARSVSSSFTFAVIVFVNGTSWWMASTRSTRSVRSVVASTFPTSRSPYRIGIAQ